MFRIPYKFGRYFSLVGADRSEMTAAQRELLAGKAEMVKGRLYGTRYYKHVEGDASLLSDKYLRENEFFSYPSINLKTNDCLVHVINYALRYPLFTDREQVVRLVMKRLKSTLEDAQLAKAESGVSIDACRDFFLYGHTVYSLAPLTKMHSFKDKVATITAL